MINEFKLDFLNNLTQPQTQPAVLFPTRADKNKVDHVENFNL